MSATSKSLNKLIEKMYLLITKHPKEVIIIPTLIGGFYQFYKLASINISYIPYFSIAQIIPDGLLWSLLFIFTFILSTIVSFYMEFSEKQKNRHKYIGKKKIIIDITIDIIGALIANILLFIALSLFSKYSFKFCYILFLLLCLIIIVSIPIIIFTGRLIEKYISKKQKKDNFNISFSKSKVKFILSLIGVPIMVSIFMAFDSFVKTPTNNVNIEQLYTDIDCKYPNNKGRNILYLNDKYIFIEITNQNKKDKIEILEFKKLFK